MKTLQKTYKVTIQWHANHVTISWLKILKEYFAGFCCALHNFWVFFLSNLGCFMSWCQWPIRLAWQIEESCTCIEVHHVFFDKRWWWWWLWKQSECKHMLGGLGTSRVGKTSHAESNFFQNFVKIWNNIESIICLACKWS